MDPHNRDVDQERRKTLYEDLKTTTAQLEDASRAERAAKDLLKSANDQLERYKAEMQEPLARLKALDTLKPGDWKQFIQSDPELNQEFKAIGKELGGTETKKAISDVQEFISDSLKFSGRAKRIIRWARESKTTWFLVLLGLVVVYLLLWWPSVFGSWVTRLGTGLSMAVSVSASVLAALAPHVKKVSRLLSRAEAVRSLVEKAADKELVGEQAKLTAVKLKSAQASQLVRDKERELSEIQVQIDDIRSGRALETFLHGRVSHADYSERRGIIAIVRDDLETLRDRLNGGFITSADSDGSTDGGVEKRIDRVVLYIDDLDRCHPKRVVEVLHAVHLLLSIDFFVVVVAVDPRWLINALKWHYEELFHSSVENLELPEEERGVWGSTPQGYVEKIFQIPFTLRPMDSKGFSNMVLGAFDVPSSGIGTERQVPSLKPKALNLFEEEKMLLALLWPIVATPRSTKRLVNIYRMIRAQLSGEELEQLRGGPQGEGEYLAVQLLLAILVGCPSLSPTIFRGLEKSNANSFWLFIKELKPSELNGKWKNAVQENLTEAEVSDWERFVRMMQDWKTRIENSSNNDRSVEGVKQTLNGVTSLKSFKKWVGEVSRYSFRAGQVVHAVAR